ncbi:MAG TPA: hypothetical protein PKH69_07810 [Thiobacillaceae bacterium]|nr:hypothetical protein [Thiobacillaceae bacterium]HNU63995.1 hypothetical protein [Thiobacillaceae bacterium]
MRLGIVVTDAAWLTETMGLIDAVRDRGWEAECFLTDTGVMLLADPGFVRRAREGRAQVSVCEHSIAHYAEGKVDTAALAEHVVIGGQYQDAELVRRCDRVLVF